MKQLVTAAVVALALGATCAPASARELVRLLETRQRSVVLIDVDSIKPVENADGEFHDAVVSIDNSRSVAAVQLYAADVKLRADCAAGELAVLWSRAYDASGLPAASPLLPVTHQMAAPKDEFERTALQGICERT